MKRQILITSISAPSLSRPTGGAQEYILNLSRSLVSCGYSIKILALNELRNNQWLPVKESIEGISIERIGRGRRDLITLVRKVYSVRKNFDVLIENSMEIPLLVSYFFKGKSYIIKHHILGSNSVRVHGMFKGFIYRFLELYMLKLSRGIWIVPSQFTKDSLTKIKGDSIEIHLLPPIVEISPLLGHEAYKETKTILFLGALNLTRKKVDDLIEAFKIVLQNHSDFELVIAGSGKDEDILKESAKGYPIRFLGSVSDRTKWRLLKECYVFVSPSIIEGFGITYLEAAICKKPIVSYDLPLDVLKGENSICVEARNVKALAEVLNRIISDRELYLYMSNRSDSVVLRFTKPFFVNRILKIFG